MTDKLIPYAVTAILGIAIGAMLMRSCDSGKTTVHSDTLRVKGPGDTVIVRTISPARIVYRDRMDTLRIVENWGGCCEEARKNYEQAWYLSEVETEAEVNQQGVSGLVAFSMPRYLESGNGLLYDLKVQNTVETKYQNVPRSFWDKWVVTLGGGIGYGLTSGKPDVVIGLNAGYTILGGGE